MLKSKYLLLALPLVIMTSSVWSSTTSMQPQSKETTTQYISDATLTTKVKSDFLADKDIKSLSISVTTNKGTVTLTGNVANDQQKKRAVMIASQVKGVKSVNDKLVINMINK